MTRTIALAVTLALMAPMAAYAEDCAYDEPDMPEAECQETEREAPISAEDFKWMGVYECGGRLESYYSSKVAYHYRTPEWEVDDEGFYRTPEGYYVVAASDMDEGTVFDGSRGLCQVLDSGCGDGVTDYYVAW